MSLVLWIMVISYERRAMSFGYRLRRAWGAFWMPVPVEGCVSYRGTAAGHCLIDARPLPLMRPGDRLELLISPFTDLDMRLRANWLSQDAP